MATWPKSEFFRITTFPADRQVQLSAPSSDLQFLSCENAGAEFKILMQKYDDRIIRLTRCIRCSDTGNVLDLEVIRYYDPTPVDRRKWYSN